MYYVRLEHCQEHIYFATLESAASPYIYNKSVRWCFKLFKFENPLPRNKVFVKLVKNNISTLITINMLIRKNDIVYTTNISLVHTQHPCSSSAALSGSHAHYTWTRLFGCPVMELLCYNSFYYSHNISFLSYFNFI